MILEILQDGKIEVERARLKHHSEQFQRRARLAPQLLAEDADLAGLRVEEARDECEQRAFSGPIQAKQYREGGRRNVNAHIV